MDEREWAMVMDYMRGNTKPLLDYIYEELGSTDLKYCADMIGKNAKYIATHDPRIVGYRNAMWFWSNNKNRMIVLEELPAKGFFRAKEITIMPSRYHVMNGLLSPDPRRLPR